MGGLPRNINSRQMAGRGKKRAALSEEPDDDEDEVEKLEEYLKQTCMKQPESERRAIRQETYATIDTLIENRPELINPESDALTNILDEAEKRFDRVQTTREAALDSHVLAIIADYGRQKAQAFNMEFVKFQPSEFAEKLKTFVNQQLGNQDRGGLTPAGWSTLGKFSQEFLKKSPALHFMCGAFERGEVIKKVTRERQEKKDNEPGKTTELKQLDSLSETEKNEATTAEVEEVLKTLWELYESNEKTPICYFEFVTNPFSFGQTVENIFYTSFLARDGYIRISLDEEGLPVLEPVEGDEEERRGENRTRKQLVISITPREWREIIKTFRITSPLIKSRATRDVRGE